MGEKRPNGFGVYDMHGNVWEWCWDGYGDYKESRADNPAGVEAAVDRVFRGGSWFNVPRNARSAYRGRFRPGFRSFNLGFRVARVQSVR